MVRLPRYLWITFAAGVVGASGIGLFAVHSQLTLKSTIVAIAVTFWAMGYLVANNLTSEMKNALSSSNYKMTDVFRKHFIRISSGLAALLMISGLVAISIAAFVTRLRLEFLVAGISTCMFGAYWLWLAMRAKNRNGMAGHSKK